MSLTNIVILRYQTHGRRFEVPCFRNRVDEYLASGREEPPTQVEKMVAFLEFLTISQTTSDKFKPPKRFIQ